ncbi:transposase [Labrenzia sp. R4_2]|uniref:DNA-binding protein n=1 Tax=Labrenzia sp. R4_2 TaxID=2821107 RepID=UPI001AD9CC14|nr:DNA-binding protein [Labrenzia sp. R4_2]MBO9421742.1 transposase [Labrenzia sp. R4_2]
MNAMPQQMPMQKQWYTARELAGLGLPGLPSTESTIIRFAKRMDWQSSSHARKRSGQGGGLEYHIDLLPAEARTALAARNRLVVLSEAEAALPAVQNNSREVARPVVSDRKPIRAADANAQQKAVADARLALLREIEHRVASGAKYRPAMVALCEAVTNGPDTDETRRLRELVHVANSRKAKVKLGLRSLYNWRRAFEDHGYKGLLPLRRKEEPLNADRYDWVAGFMAFYATPQKRTAAHALRMYRNSLDNPDKAPSYDQVLRYLDKLNTADPIAANRGREGCLALKARKVFVSRSTEGLLPTDIYTADGKTFDAYVAHPVNGAPIRPEITTVLDVVTRRCVGYSIGLDENSRDVAAAIRWASIYGGVAAIFYADRGSGFKNELLDDAAIGLLVRLGTRKEHSLPYNSQARGIIERVNGSAYTPLAKELETYIGKDLDREARLRLEKQLRNDFKERGFSDLLVEWDEFRKRVDEALSQYNDRPHSTLPKLRDPVTGNKRHMSPNEYWNWFEENGFRPFRLSEEEVNDLDRPAVRRVVQRGLIEFNKNRYYAPELERFDGQTVMVCYEENDGSKIWVRELDKLDGQDTPGRLIAIAKFESNRERYFPLSVVEDAREKRLARQIKRKTDKIRDLEDQSRPYILLEESAQPQMERLSSAPGVLDLMAEPVEPEPELVPSAPSPALAVTQTPKKRVFASDVELAQFALEFPELLTENQKKVLRGCLSRRTDLDLFRLSGIDVAALGNVLRAAA